MSTTILRLGWTNPQTGAFGDHPVLGPVLDLNDGATFTLTTPNGIELPPPPRTLVTTGNVRTQGERATRAIYRHNRRAVARVLVGPMASYADLAATLRTLVSWLSAPPAVPVALMYQPIGATSAVYLDVVGAAHDVSEDEGDWLRLQLEPVELVFVARPGLRGDRVALQNLALNPGFEAPSGPGVSVFSDAFTNVSAYKVLSGTAPTTSAGVMTVYGGSTITFGSPAWGAINTWQIRFNYYNGLNAFFYPHYVDGNNHLQIFTSGTTLYLTQVVAGTGHDLASAAVTLANGTYYWLRFTQFPSAPGSAPDTQVTLLADSAGAPGTAMATLGPVATYDAVTALAGVMGFSCSGGNLLLGGNYPNVHAVSLFGPGGWSYLGGSGAGSGTCSGAWEQDTANTYTGGPVASFGAARIDLPPTGTVSAAWFPYNGGTPTGNGAIPVTAAGNTLGLSAMTRSAGLSASARISLLFNEYDASGTYLRQTAVASSGGSGTWISLSGSVSTGASCAYGSVLLQVADAVAGASANGTVWFENVQVWNRTSSGAATMPYCELRFSQSPAQLVVSGLLGDLPAPAFVAFGTYLANWPTGGTLSFALGRRGTVSATARLTGVSHGWYAANATPTATAVLDAASYGGYYAQATVAAGWNPRAFSFAPADAPGVYHVLARFLTQQVSANLGNVEVRATMQQRLRAWYGALDSSDQLNIYYAPFVFPMTASNAWTVVDSGQVAVPAFNAGALADPTQTYLTPHTQWADLTSGGSVCAINWQMLLPVDGSLLTGVLNNPSNAPFAVAGSWLWTYFDGLGTNLGLPAAWAYSVESSALPNPAHGSGGPGTTGSGAINVNSGADPYLTVDPQLQLGGNGGVNQLAAYISDGSGSVLPVHADLQYTPLYLYPR